MKRSVVLLFLLGASCQLCNAQAITNVQAKPDGNKVIISYDIDCEFSTTISLFYSENGGKNYIGPLSSVSGDVGDKISSGKNKKIFWDVLSETSIVFGDNITFKVAGSKGVASVTEVVIDQTPYKIIQIGNQVWMAENLKKPTNGNSWCYDNKKENCEKYGYLYTWTSAVNACPSGWKLPSEKDWNELIDVLGGDNIAGGKLKALTEWNSPNKDATNESNFCSIPSGYRMDNDTYHFWGRSSFYWIADELDSENGKYISLSNTHGRVIRNHSMKNYGFAVRCIKK
jgi:uncharacterized protein (TIGR02145 family)